MIPVDWMPHRRPDDGELVGYLVMEDDGFVPLTLFGYPLAGAVEIGDAEAVLEEHGLAVLAEPWTLDVGGRGPTTVRITEVRPDRVVVVEDDLGAASVVGVGGHLPRHVLPVPAPGTLRR